ncbi:BBS12 [Branchiostoma lanceolatum]|uniref:BBS12 protein n=1 Tax=Branchiostoma lanceolatum TaxID=7740 RepID=A0A8K0A0Y8_BRALA|nr:BBS12 [Branchiostoma lanceolatum]
MRCTSVYRHCGIAEWSSALGYQCCMEFGTRLPVLNARQSGGARSRVMSKVIQHWLPSAETAVSTGTEFAIMASLSGNPNGLEVLMAVASCAQSLLGPHRTLKCIVEDDSDPEGSVLVSTAPELLSNLNMDHPVGQLLNSACQSHHRTYGTGSTTLVCMAGFLARAARHCVRMGVPVSAVCHCLEEGVSTTSQDVGAMTSVGLLEDHTFQSDKGASVLIKIGTPGRTWSVVLCSLTKAELHDVEQHFWSCLNRLKNVLSERKVLPGGGSPELTCIRCLRDTTGADLPLASFHPRSWLSSCFHQFRCI